MIFTQADDLKFYVKENESKRDLIAEHNHRVVEDSILRYEKMRADKLKLSNEGIEERSDAIATFFRHINMGGNNNIEKYFGKKELARLRGQEIVAQLKTAKALRDSIK